MEYEEQAARWMIRMTLAAKAYKDARDRYRHSRDATTDLRVKREAIDAAERLLDVALAIPVLEPVAAEAPVDPAKTAEVLRRWHEEGIPPDNGRGLELGDVPVSVNGREVGVAKGAHLRIRPTDAEPVPDAGTAEPSACTFRATKDIALDDGDVIVKGATIECRACSRSRKDHRPCEGREEGFECTDDIASTCMATEAACPLHGRRE
jgi:hypothetical protein